MAVLADGWTWPHPAGQNHHFARYVKETHRLCGEANHRLADREFLAGDYSITDMSTYPCIAPYECQGQNLAHFPNVGHCFEAISKRPAVERAFFLTKMITSKPAVTEEFRKIRFGQTAETLRKNRAG